MATKTANKVDLDALIPDKSEALEYISRTFGGERDIDILDKARRMEKNTLLFGPTGPGKTSVVMAYCAEFEFPFYSIPCNQSIEPDDVIGAHVPTEQAGLYKWQDGIVTAMAREGRGVVLLDEVNFLRREIAAFFHPLLDKRRMITLLRNSGEVIKAGDDFQVIAAYNPGYEGTKPLNEAFKNRFAFKLHFDYDTEIEKQLINLDVLRSIAEQLRLAHGVSLDTPVSTNMLMDFEDVAYELGLDFAVENFVNAFNDEERPAVKEVLQLRNQELTDSWKQLMGED